MTNTPQNLPESEEPTAPAPLPAADTVAALRAKLADAESRISALQAQAAQEAAAKRDLETTVTKLTTVQLQQTEDEKLIADKMAKGLTRPQAIAVIRRQRQFDESDHGKLMKARHERAQLR